MTPTKNKADVAIPYSLLRVHLNPFTLGFSGNDKPLEKPFQDTFFSNSLEHVRRCKIYAILFFSIFGILDAAVFPNHKLQLWFIRYVVVCPVFIIGLFVSYTPMYRYIWQPVNALYIMVTGLAYVVMVMITPAPESYFYCLGTIFCIFFGYTFVHARFLTASIAGSVVIIGYQVAVILLGETSAVVQLILGSHLIGINVLGMIICYSIEKQQRKNFFLNHLLEEEKKKTDDINRNLEKRVEARTAALQRINRDLNKEILERKQAESRVRSSHEKLAHILDSIDADIYVTDINTRVILLANHHMKETYGEYLVGKKCHDAIFGFSTPCRSCKLKLLLDENGNPGKGHSWEEKNPINDRWYIIYARAISWEDGRLVQLQVAKDITAMKQMEARLQRAEKMEAIGTLAGGVAHDLNNILSGLVGYPELLLMDVPEGSQTYTVIETIKRSGEKAAAIVQDMLTLARRGVAVTDIVGLNQIVQDYLNSPELANLKSNHPDISFAIDLTSSVFNIVGSPIHLSKTLMNLATNAAEAMPGGGTVTISTKNRYLDGPIQGFETIPEGEYVRLRVADTGIGIPSSDLEKIFEPFYTKKKMGRSGTGLGMAVVWGTVKDHHGFIDVRSIEEKGTVFDLFFPITRQKAEKEIEEIPLDQYRGAGEKVLVVDDIKEQCDLAAFMLRRLNYQVSTVSNGMEAVEFVRKNAVDILILDMIMTPEMDGLETYRQILTIAPGQKAIITSGFSESQRVVEAQKLGAGRYIKKPYRMEQIGMAVREQLARESVDVLIGVQN